MNNENLQNELLLYLNDYKRLSKKFGLNSKINKYGIVYSKEDLQERTKNIQKIVLDIGQHFDFTPEYCELDIKPSLNNVLIDNIPEKYQKIITKDYYQRLSKIKKVEEEGSNFDLKKQSKNKQNDSLSEEIRKIKLLRKERKEQREKEEKEEEEKEEKEMKIEKEVKKGEEKEENEGSKKNKRKNSSNNPNNSVEESKSYNEKFELSEEINESNNEVNVYNNNNLNVRETKPKNEKSFSNYVENEKGEFSYYEENFEQE